MEHYNKLIKKWELTTARRDMWDLFVEIDDLMRDGEIDDEELDKLAELRDEVEAFMREEEEMNEAAATAIRFPFGEREP